MQIVQELCERDELDLVHLLQQKQGITQKKTLLAKHVPDVERGQFPRKWLR
jgi:hypothetical protein